MPWYLNPFVARRACRDLRRIRAGGGPRSLRVAGVSGPHGWLVPSATIQLEVTAEDGSRTSLRPDLPIAPPLAYGYRLARLLGVPVISEIDPQALDLGIEIPR